MIFSSTIDKRCTEMLTKTPKVLILLSIIIFGGLFIVIERISHPIKLYFEKVPNSESVMQKQNKKHPPSILGEWLHSPQGTCPPKRIHPDDSSTLLILVWKYGLFLERRHIRRFTDNPNLSPWQDCSVKDCRLSYEERDLPRADAVLFHLHLTKSVRELPSKRGKPDQLWIFMTDESPLHTFLYKTQNISEYDNLFDWSMTYRSDSDVPVPYGRTISKHDLSDGRKAVETDKRIFVGKTKLAAIMGSNCSGKNGRWKYVKGLKRRLGDGLDIYGKCLFGNTTACPGHFERDCLFLDSYKFYLAFENSNCREYMTEKLFWNAYEKRSVPVIMGSSLQDCKRLLPPESFIHVDDFSNPDELANYIRYLDGNETAYEKFHKWRSDYVVLNEHGYFGSASRHYCRICEALRYNDRPISTYQNLSDYWSWRRDCDFNV